VQRIASLQQQLRAFGEGQCLLIGPQVDRRALHKLHREPGVSVRFDAAIEQRRDVRVVQLREVVALAHESIDQRRRRDFAADALERHALLVLAVGTACLVYRPHPAGPQQAVDAPRSQPIAYATGSDVP